MCSDKLMPCYFYELASKYVRENSKTCWNSRESLSTATGTKTADILTGSTKKLRKLMPKIQTIKGPKNVKS